MGIGPIRRHRAAREAAAAAKAAEAAATAPEGEAATSELAELAEPAETATAAEAAASTPLADDFPAREKLAKAGITTVEALKALSAGDLTADDLMKAGLFRKEASAVLAALGS